MARISLLAFIPFVLLTSACSNHVDTFSPPFSIGASALHPTLPIFNSALLASYVTPISVDAITELNEEQKNDFFRYFNKPINQNTAPNQRAYNYLSLVIDQLRYSDETLTAEQTLLQQSGNCLSLANLTKAIAKLANVDIAFHLMENNPAFGFQGNFLTKTDHIRAVLKGRTAGIGPHNASDTFNMTTNLRVDYFPTDHLRYIDGMSEELQTSLYFSNLAVDFILNKQYDSAFSHAAKALEVSLNNSSALNVIGIIHRRLGDQATAEKIYRYGAHHLRDKATFWRNYTTLLESQGRTQEAKSISNKVLALNSVDPWHWIRSGLDEYQQKNFIQAIEFYERALAIAPDLDRVHFHSAKAHLALGQKQQSEEHLEKAIEHAQKSSIRGRYKAKLYALKKN